MRSAHKMKLSQIVQAGVKKFTYVYDFGDNWRHMIQVEKVLEPAPKAKYPRCVKGSRAGPPALCPPPTGRTPFCHWDWRAGLHWSMAARSAWPCSR